MNIYFLVEGKTERKVYQKWISYFLPNFTRFYTPEEACENNYYLISGGGYPSILDNHLIDSASDVTSCGNFDLLVLALDTDEVDGNSKVEEVSRFVTENSVKFGSCKFIVVPQVVCMETWFLGNRRIFPRNARSQECAELIKHFNVSTDDPETMQKPLDFDGTVSNFHYKYLKKVLSDRNIRYSKSHPVEVTEPYYIGELEARIKSDVDSMKSMRNLILLFQSVKSSAIA